MNILQILPSLDVGGVETGTVDLARYLVRHGHKAIVVSGGGRLVKRLDAVGARHYTLPVGRKSLLTMVVMIRRLCRIVRSEGVDIVHARSRVPAIIAYFACKITKCVFITTAHGYYKRHLFSRPMAWGKFVIVASNIMAKHMAANFGVPHSRIRLIPRGVDLERFKFRDLSSRDSGEFVIGMVSRITPLKGHADFIKAVSVLNRQIPHLKAMIVGEAPKAKYKEELDLLTRRLGLSGAVEFLGARDDVPLIMERLDVAVLATVTPEAFGRTIIEAQASGAAVVATKVGGVVDIVDDGKTGLLCAAQNPKDMADKILRLYRDRALRKNMAVEARRCVEKYFDVKTMMEKTVALYEEALAKSNILVIKISAIGDVILSIPSLRAIRSKYPNANLKVLVGLQARDVLDGCPYIDDRIVCDFKGKHRGLGGLMRLGKDLRNEWFEIVLDLQNNRKSHALAFLSLAGLRYGYDNGKFSFFLNKKIKDDAPYLDPIDHQFRTLKILGIRPSEKRLEMWPSQHDEDSVQNFLKGNWISPAQQLVGINVRASSRWATKNWPASFITELCDRLAREFNVRTVLTGTKEDVELANQISKMSRSKALVAAGNTGIGELASLIRHFKVYLTPDSAPMHIAASVGTPFISLFGPTDPARHLPPSQNCTVICKSGEFKCSPCYSPVCMKKITCMRKITVDEVLEEMKKFLRREVS